MDESQDVWLAVPVIISTVHNSLKDYAGPSRSDEASMRSYCV